MVQTYLHDLGGWNASSVEVQERDRAHQGKPPAAHDRILDFSTAVTGTLFFAPALDFLDDPLTRQRKPPAESPDDAEPEAPPPAPAGGSLAIGSLKPAS